MERESLDFWGRPEPDTAMQTTLKTFADYLNLSEGAEIELLAGRTETAEEEAEQEASVLHGTLPSAGSFYRHRHGSDTGLLSCLAMASLGLRAWPMNDSMLKRTVEQLGLGRMGDDLSANGAATLMDDTGHELYHAFAVTDGELTELLDNGAAVICCVSSLLMQYPEAAALPCVEPDRFVLVLAVETNNGEPATVYYADPADGSSRDRDAVPRLSYAAFARAWAVSDRRTVILYGEG